MRRLIFTLFILVLIMWPDRHSNGQQSNAPGQVTSGYPIRRVVTGKNAEGKSAVIFDGPAPVLRGQSMIWVTDSAPVDNSGNRDAAQGLTPANMRPNSTGSVIRFETFPPGFGVHCKGACTEQSDLEGQPGDVFHHSKTIDYLVFLSGETYLVMGDGKETLIKAGDVVVQRGVVHRWINRGKVPCRAAVILIGANEVQP